MTTPTRSLPRALCVALLILATRPALSTAQSGEGALTRMARGFAVVTTSAALAGAPVIDLDTRGLPTVSLGAVTVGVSQIEMKDEVGVRLHVFFYNATEEAVSIPLPTDSTFTLVDNRGRRLLYLTLRFAKALPKGATALTVPALERVSATVLFNMKFTPDAEGVLKVAGAGAIRGIPMRDAAGVPPAAAPPPPDTARADTARADTLRARPPAP